MSDDTAAIAAYGTWTGESTGQVLADWVLLPGSGRAQWRAIADAAITAASLRQPQELREAMGETHTLAGHLDLATRLMLDLGSDQLAASARRIRKAAGLELA